MAYVVNAQAGDTLCSIARANGYSNCGTVRSHAANAGLLARPLVVGDQVTIPGFRDTWFYGKVATGRRWTVVWYNPPVAPVAATIQLVRKTAAAPAIAAALVDIGISRFVPNAITPAGVNDWCDHTVLDFDGPSNGDPSTFSIEVNDPAATAGTVSVYLEALQPLYPAPLAHQRFAPGARRDERTLWVTAQHLGALPAGRFWSCELRLVTWPFDKALRAQQTLLVSDLHDSQGMDIEILDQNIRAVYEDASCPNAPGSRCIKAWHEIPLRRGRSVTLDGFIMRLAADGTNQDNGVVSHDAYRQRVRVNCRRVFAQEELSFTFGDLRTIDPPSDMLVVAEADDDRANGANARGNNGQGQQGQIGFTLTYTPFAGVAQAHVIGPLDIPAGNTPVQTAALLLQALTVPPRANITALAMPNPPDAGTVQGSVDIMITAANGTARITGLTADEQQDADQKVQNVHFDTNWLVSDQDALSLRKAGSPTRRQLFKSQPTNPQHISIFVVRQGHGGLTAMALHPLAVRGLGTDPAVCNCLTMNYGFMDDDLAFGLLTLPHELGHALSDADHLPRNLEIRSLMVAGLSQNPDGTGNFRISGPGYAPHPYQLVGDNVLRLARAATWVEPVPAALDLIEYNTTMHDLIAANGSILFTPR